MICGLISDIHANLEALEKVLSQLQGVDAYLCLGDIVGYGPNPNECVELVTNLPNLTCVAGNHDLAAVDKYDPNLFNKYAREAIAWTSRKLCPASITFLRELELVQEVPPFTLVHGSLPDPMEYVLSPVEARQTFFELKTQACLIGHTHITEYYRQRVNSQMVDRFSLYSGGEVPLSNEFRHLINIGSVGQPRDGSVKASYATWEPENNTVSVYRVNYNIQKTQEKMKAAGLPEYLVQRLAQGR